MKACLAWLHCVYEHCLRAQWCVPSVSGSSVWPPCQGCYLAPVLVWSCMRGHLCYVHALHAEHCIVNAYRSCWHWPAGIAFGHVRPSNRSLHISLSNNTTGKAIWGPPEVRHHHPSQDQLDRVQNQTAGLEDKCAGLECAGLGNTVFCE